MAIVSTNSFICTSKSFEIHENYCSAFLLVGLIEFNLCVLLLKTARVVRCQMLRLETLTGENISADKLSNDGKPMIIDFWATWCKPCIEELNAIHEEYATWQKETGVKLVTVSLDDARTMSRVAPL